MENKITNKDIMEYIFNKIREFGFKPYDVTHPDGYFLMEGESYSVIHFRLKGVWKHWKFGMWLNAEYLDEHKRNEYKEKYDCEDDEFKVIRIFCQYDTQIDKFKPSASSLCVEYDVDDWEHREQYKGLFYKLENMLKMIKYHPLIAYDGFCGEYAGYAYHSFLLNFLKYEWFEVWGKVKEVTQKSIWCPYTKVKIFFAKRAKCIKDITWYNFEKENPGWSTSFLYKVRVFFTDESTESDQINWMKLWFHRDEYGKYGWYDDVVEVEYMYKGNYIYFDEGDENNVQI